MGFWYWLVESFILFFQDTPNILAFLGLIIIVYSVFGILMFGLVYENIYLVLITFTTMIIGMLLLLYAQYLNTETFIYYLNLYV